jgi:hypothetical protein
MNVPNHHQYVINMQNVQIQSDIFLVNVTRDSSEMEYRIVQVLMTVLDNFFEEFTESESLSDTHAVKKYLHHTLFNICIIPILPLLIYLCSKN